MWVPSRGRGDPLEAGHGSLVFLTGRIPWTEEPGWTRLKRRSACAPRTGEEQTPGSLQLCLLPSHRPLPLPRVFKTSRSANLMCTSTYLNRRMGMTVWALRCLQSCTRSRLEVKRTRPESLTSPPASCILNFSRSQYSHRRSFSTQPH